MKMFSTIAAAAMMTAAYVTYCGPVTSDVQKRLDQEIQTLTPDQRWRLDHRNSWFGQVLSLGSEADLENYPPSARERMIKHHAKTCMTFKNRIDKAIDALPPLVTTP
jgi:hypothetical protein